MRLPAPDLADMQNSQHAHSHCARPGVSRRHVLRLCRYAFGCSELLFHPLHKWPHRSPFTKLFRSFLVARGIPMATKMSVVAYLSTYIGALLCLCECALWAAVSGSTCKQQYTRHAACQDERVRLHLHCPA